MSDEQIAFQITFASVDSANSQDPSAQAQHILSGERVLAALRGFDGDAAVVLIPITDDGKIVALDDEGRLRFDLDAARLQALFAEQGLTLQLGFADDALESVDAELDEQFGEAFEQLDDPAASSEDLAGFGMLDEVEGDVFAIEPVRVAEFSHRGRWAARLTAQILRTPVDYLESGTWSLYRYRTDQPHQAISGGRSDGPIIELNVPQLGDAWIEVTSARGHTGMFWPNAAQHTQPVLDLDSIQVAESAEVYRRMLIEADGAGDELAQLAIGTRVDVETAQQACIPEAVGGTVGERERLLAFVAAFGVPVDLVEAALDEGEPLSRIPARGWPGTAADLLLGGLEEMTALTRRARPSARFARFLRERPMLGAALSTAELAAGVALGRSRSRLGRGLGILLAIDAVADLVIWTVRARRR